MATISDHEAVSVYPFSQEQIEHLLTNAGECVLNWATQDCWPIGVVHAFVWQRGRVWVTFAAHRHRTAAIKRNPRVSIVVSSTASRAEGSPAGSITIKGRAVLHEDQETKGWFYPALAAKTNPQSAEAAARFAQFLDSPLRLILEVVPEKWITFDAAKFGADSVGQLPDQLRGPKLESDTIRFERERRRRGLA